MSTSMKTHLLIDRDALREVEVEESASPVDSKDGDLAVVLVGQELVDGDAQLFPNVRAKAKSVSQVHTVVDDLRGP